MNKPTTLLIEEFKKNISNLINESQLPVFVLEYLIRDVYLEVSNLSKQIAQKEISEYNDSLENKEEQTE